MTKISRVSASVLNKRRDNAKKLDVFLEGVSCFTTQKGEPGRLVS